MSQVYNKIFSSIKAPQLGDMLGHFTQTNDSVVAATMVKDDVPYLKYWIRHYRRELPQAMLLVIDHGSMQPLEKAVESDDNVVFLRLPTTPFDDELRALGVSCLINFLHSFFGTVIFVDVDELIVPDKRKYENLQDFLVKNKEVPTPLGIDIVHNIDTEETFDWSKSIGSQRQYGCASGAYSKAAITRGSGVVYSPGFHKRYPYDPISKELFLLHFQKIDKKTYLDRYNDRQHVSFSENQKKGGYGEHWQSDIDTKEKFFMGYAERCRKITQPLDVEKEVNEMNATIHHNQFGCYGVDIKHLSEIGLLPDYIKEII